MVNTKKSTRKNMRGGKAKTKSRAKTKAKATANGKSTTQSGVIFILSMSDIPKYENATKNTAAVGIVLADWCGACQRIKPVLNKSLETPTRYNRIIVDSNVADNIPSLKNNITKYPSFFVLKNGAPIDQVSPEGVSKALASTPNTAEEMIEIANNPPSLNTKFNVKSKAEMPGMPGMANLKNTSEIKKSNAKLAKSTMNEKPVSKYETSLEPEPLSQTPPQLNNRKVETSKTFVPKYISS